MPTSKRPVRETSPAAAAPAPKTEEPARAATPGRVRFGTSSFSSEDWVGPFYPEGTAPADFLRLYAKAFDTVEVDSTYYAVPAARTVDGWIEKTPESFLISAKFPRSIVHGGESERPDPARVLVPAATEEDRDRFLAVMRRLGHRLGPLILQFPYFNREAFPSPGPFFDRLDAFLERLPEDLVYGVEVRNKAWVDPTLREICARHRASLVLVDQAWMPHGDEVAAKMDPVTADVVYVRLLGDRQAVERLSKSFDREVIDHADRLARWARLLAKLSRRGVPSLVYVNNHYAGHAPTTARRLKALYEAEVARQA